LTRWAVVAALGAAGASPVAAQAPPRPTFQIESGHLVVPSPVVFESAGDKLKPESTPALEHVKAYLEDKTYITLLRIESHTDGNGAPDANLALTLKRSVAVARWLVSHGIDCKRLIAVGFGGTKPVADNATAEGREHNRRMVFVNAALRDRPIGGMPVDGGGRVADANLCAK
jgi:OOP family OmpA-OmpF porin